METYADPPGTFFDLPADVIRVILAPIGFEYVLRISLASKNHGPNMLNMLQMIKLDKFNRYKVYWDPSERTEPSIASSASSPAIYLSNLTNLRCLDLSNGTDIRSETLHRLENLSELHFGKVESPEELSRLQSLTNITNLSICIGPLPFSHENSDGSKLDQKSLPSMLHSFRGLTKINLLLRPSRDLIEGLCSIETLKIVETVPMVDSECFGLISRLAPRRPRFLCPGGVTYWSCTESERGTKEIKDVLYDFSVRFPSETLNINAKNLSNGLSPLQSRLLHQCCPNHLNAALKALINCGADPDSKFPLSSVLDAPKSLAVPNSLRLLSSSDLSMQRVHPISAAILLRYSTSTIELLWNAAKHLDDMSEFPPLLAAFCCNTGPDPLTLDCILAKQKINPFKDLTITSSTSQLIWIRIIPVLEALLRRNWLVASTLLQYFSNGAEEYKKEMAESAAHRFPDGGTILHKLCQAAPLCRNDSQWNQLTMSFWDACDDPFVSDAAGNFPLDYWLESPDLRYLPEFKLTHHRLLQLLLVETPFNADIPHHRICKLATAVSCPTTIALCRDLYRELEKQDDQNIMKFFERMVELRSMKAFGFYLLPEESHDLILQGNRRISLQELKARPRFNSSHLEPALGCLMESLHLWPRGQFHRLDFLLFAANGCGQSKGVDFMQRVISTGVDLCGSLSLFGQCGCHVSSPTLIFPAIQAVPNPAIDFIHKGSPISGQAFVFSDSGRDSLNFVQAAQALVDQGIINESNSAELLNLLLNIGHYARWTNTPSAYTLLAAYLVKFGASPTHPQVLLKYAIDFKLPMDYVMAILAHLKPGAVDEERIWDRILMKTVLTVPQKLLICDGLASKVFLLSGGPYDHIVYDATLAEKVLGIASSSSFMERETGLEYLMSLVFAFLGAAILKPEYALLSFSSILPKISVACAFPLPSQASILLRNVGIYPKFVASSLSKFSESLAANQWNGIENSGFSESPSPDSAVDDSTTRSGFERFANVFRVEEDDTRSQEVVSDLFPVLESPSSSTIQPNFVFSSGSSLEDHIHPRESDLKQNSFRRSRAPPRRRKR